METRVKQDFPFCERRKFSFFRSLIMEAIYAVMEINIVLIMIDIFLHLST